MKIDEFSIRAKNEAQCVLSWVSESEETYSWIFINGKFALGPFMPMTLERSITIPFPFGTTALIEIHDFDDMDMIPNSCEEMPQIRPLLSWNPVDEAVKYRVYQGDFATGDESLDKYHNESDDMGELVKYFASDLPPVPELTITKQPNNKYTISIS